jgi:hypothetical protein
MKFDYLRGRPFLVVELSVHPAAHARTERAGWRKNLGNVRVLDLPRIVNRISDKIMRQASIIIDLKHDCVIKNRHKANAEMFDDEALKHCKEKYSDMIYHAKLAASLDVG